MEGGVWCLGAAADPAGAGRQQCRGHHRRGKGRSWAGEGLGTDDPHGVLEGRRDILVTRVGTIYPMILPQVHLRKPCYDFSFL